MIQYKIIFSPNLVRAETINLKMGKKKTHIGKKTEPWTILLFLPHTNLLVLDYRAKCKT